MRLLLIELIGPFMAGAAMAAVAADNQDDKVRAYCAFGGALGSIAHILRKKIYEQKGVILVLFWNGIISIVASPFLCWALLTWIGLPLRFDACSAFALGFALAVPWLFDDVLPAFGKNVKTFVRNLSIKDLLARLLNLRSDDKRDIDVRNRSGRDREE